MPKKNNITLDDLATMVMNGFHDVQKQFIGIDKRFIGIDKRFDQIEDKLHEHDKEFEMIRFALTELARKDEVRTLTERFDRAEKKFGIA
jgi:archaellum component FlaC